MATVGGVDVSENQNINLPWLAWFASGKRIVVARASIGFRDDIHFTRYVAAAFAAGYIVGAYHVILPKQYYDPIRQATEFLELIPPQVAFLVLDIEAPGVSDSDVLTWVIHVTMHSTLPLVLYGNWDLARIVLANPSLNKYGVWWAGYPTFPLPTTEPPWPRPKNVPAGLRLIAWQYAGDNGVLPPYKGAIDLNLWYEIPGDGAPVPPPGDDDAALKDAIRGHANSIKGLVTP